jgi:uncharacterized protein (TIGR03089 family)
VHVLTVADLLERALHADAARPFVTFYDDATSERIELSVATFANWVAKTANLLVEEADLEPGEPVAVDLPPHWQTAVVLVAIGLAGGVVGDAGRIAFWAEGEPRPDGAEEIIGLGLRPLGRGLSAPVPGVLDYAAEVPSFGDVFVPTDPAPVGNVDELAHRVFTFTLAPLFPVLAGGGSLVLCRHPDPNRLPDRATTERVTATWGVDLPGLPRRG